LAPSLTLGLYLASVVNWIFIWFLFGVSWVDSNLIWEIHIWIKLAV
jgi:hypothetical protein